MKSAKFDDEFIKGLIKQDEGQKLDFKQKITSKEKIAKTLCALSNTEGGIILIGISDKKKIIGIDPEEERYMIESSNEEFCIPNVSLTIDEVKVEGEKGSMEEDENELYLLLVNVQKSTGPLVYCKSKSGELKVYHRVKDQTQVLGV